jgi:AraC-like DNA-binding protein
VIAMMGRCGASCQVASGQNMVRTGQEAVARLNFRPQGRQVGLEVMSWAEMENRGGPPRWPHRTDFHTLVLIESGRLPYHLDFVEMDRGSRSVLWARPGQVQQFGRPQAVRARLLLFVAEFLAPSDALVPLLHGPRPPASWALTPQQHARVAATVEELQRALVRADDPLHLQFAQHALTALLLGLGALAADTGARGASSQQDVFARLHDEIERSYMVSRRAEDYASRLGYSTKTLTRAARAATGLTLKQLIDDRVILEAKRSLAHTTAPAETIAHQLGFSEASNFSKFFSRHTGETAGAFRERVRAARA